MLERKSLELQRSVVQGHAEGIGSYLKERFQFLRLIGHNHSLDEICEPGRLEGQLEVLNRTTGGGFVDLGVIDLNGNHLRYVGPFDLEGRNYSGEDWFMAVVADQEHLSDVFLGFRRVPHSIIAVRAGGNGEVPFILRATINGGQFDDLVHAGLLGNRADVYVLNREGRLQTASKTGSQLDLSPLPVPASHRGVADRRVRVGGEEKIQMSTWLNHGRWALVVEQDAREVRAPVQKAFATGAAVVLFSVLVLTLTIILATRYRTGRIDRAKAAREEMFRAFMRSARLASVGELATGLAHEINNPLAVISAERTNLADLTRIHLDHSPGAEEAMQSLDRISRQVERCAGITSKMLQFGRKGEALLEPIDLAPRLSEIVTFMGRQAGVRNIDLSLETDPDLPAVIVDATELEQVLVNLVNNAFQAMPDGGRVLLGAHRVKDEVHLTVEDNGEGIPPEVLDRVFEPFFTTKPAGQGTGLGLSICYGLVQSWGGRIEAESRPGEGARIRIRLPLPAAGRKERLS
jgi:two-component system NtrC family sensor kinase